MIWCNWQKEVWPELSLSRRVIWAFHEQVRVHKLHFGRLTSVAVHSSARRAAAQLIPGQQISGLQRRLFLCDFLCSLLLCGTHRIGKRERERARRGGSQGEKKKRHKQKKGKSSRPHNKLIMESRKKSVVKMFASCCCCCCLDESIRTESCLCRAIKNAK